MGCVDNITADRFPEQGHHLGSRARIVFHYDRTRQLGGVVIRDDAEAPWQTVIQLDDGRVVLASECQYRPLAGPKDAA